MEAGTSADLDPVLRRLEGVVAQARANRDRLGFFAAVYRQVTRELQRAVEAGVFDDPARVVRLALTFSGRYFVAFDAFRSGQPTSGCWRIAFASAARGRLTILQDLLLGINAHINLDLCVAAAEQAEAGRLDGLRADFGRVNDIITELLDPSESVVDGFSPAIDLLDRVGGRTDETIVNFSIHAAREEAWLKAQVLAAQPAEDRPHTISVLDRAASVVARGIAEPGFPFDQALQVVRLTESQDVPAIIDALNALPAP